MYAHSWVKQFFSVIFYLIADLSGLGEDHDRIGSDIKNGEFSDWLFPSGICPVLFQASAATNMAGLLFW